MKRSKNFLAMGFIFAIMFLIAMNDNVRGVFIPAFKEDFSANNTQMGLVLTVGSLGYMLFTYIGGILCEKIGQKKVMSLGFLTVILSLIEIYFSKSYIMLLIGLFFSNVGVSLLAIGINTLIPVLMVSFQAILMNLIHFCYGAGATITQRSAGILLYRGMTWRSIYLMIAVFFLVVFTGFFFIKIPEPEKSHDKGKIDNSVIFRNKITYFYMVALGLYVTAEMATGSWFVNFMREVYKYNEDRSTFYSALFFGIFTIGRLLGGFVVERFGRIKSVAVSLGAAFLLYSIGLIMGDKGIIIISLSGLFFAITFPTIVLTINRVFTKNSAYVTGIIITAASAISMVMNMVIGLLNDIIGVYLSFYVIPISLFISMTFTYLIYINTKEIA